ncbi:DUF2065 domain-containing protein [Ferrimonas gelatinilytica]|uniref:DUF2065 domain-containing protein n=1 Tax=Ferrimonas gelatinilytica TaxID=1255257 RepID=A0ABP9S2V8_9GAMM
MSCWIWGLAVVLLLEGVGPLLFPEQWRRMVLNLSALEAPVLRRVGGALVTAALVLFYIFSP